MESHQVMEKSLPSRNANGAVEPKGEMNTAPAEHKEAGKAEVGKEQQLESVVKDAEMKVVEAVAVPEEEKKSEVEDESQEIPDKEPQEEKNEEEIVVQLDKLKMKGVEEKENEEPGEINEEGPDEGKDSVKKVEEQEEQEEGKKGGGHEAEAPPQGVAEKEGEPQSKRKMKGRGTFRYRGNDEGEGESEDGEEYETLEEGPLTDEEEEEDEEGKPSGDSKEDQKKKEKLDDDQQRDKPQYIPKSGPFYQHDNRNDEGKKKGRVVPDKWTNDKFNPKAQAPKTKEELIARYGYDIRSDEGPPRAQKQTKYGRGSSKGGRNWKDTDASKKPFRGG